MSMRNMFVCAAAGLLLTGSAVFAQQAGQDQAATERQHQMQAQPGQQPHVPGQAHPGMHRGKLILSKANEVIGKEVVNRQGEQLGHIRELAIDGNTGQVAYAVLEFDRLTDLRDKLFAVPWTALEPKREAGQVRTPAEEQAARDRLRAGKEDETWFMEDEKDAKEFVLNVSKEKLAQAPGFDRDKWPEMANPQWGGEVHKFYNQRPYWEQRPGLQGRMERERDARTDVDVNVRTETERPAGQAREGEMAHGQQGQRMILKAKEQLIGKDLHNTQGEDIGELNNILIDRRTGKIAFVVVKIDEGVEGDKDMAALPWNQIDWKWSEEEKEGTITLKTNVNQIKGQMFAENNWPDLSNRQFAMNIYRQFNASPYWEERGAEDVLGFQE